MAVARFLFSFIFKGLMNRRTQVSKPKLELDERDREQIKHSKKLFLTIENWIRVLRSSKLYHLLRKAILRSKRCPLKMITCSFLRLLTNEHHQGQLGNVIALYSLLKCVYLCMCKCKCAFVYMYIGAYVCTRVSVFIRARAPEMLPTDVYSLI